MFKKLLLLAAVILATAGAHAQLVYSSPKPLQQTSDDVYVYYNTTLGNKALMDLPQGAMIFAHTGVITDKSKNSGDWKHAPSWGDNSDKYKLERVETNLWRLKVGKINDYYGITDEVVEQLAFVFRGVGADGKTSLGEGKTAAGGDIFLSVLPAGLQVQIETTLESLTLLTSTQVGITVSATEDCNISLFVNDQLAGNVQGKKVLNAVYTVSEPGDYTFRAEAVKGDEVATTETKCSMLTPSKQADYPGGVPKMGTVRNEDGTVTFCIAAPGKTLVNLIGQWNNYQMLPSNAMNYQDYEGARYFWLTVNKLRDDYPYLYYYMIDGNTAVGDPYAKLILDPGMDNYIPKDVYPNLPEYPKQFVKNNVCLAVYQENINDYDWKIKDFKAPEKKDLVVYELLLRDFTGTEGKAQGNGTVKKALEKLPYLVDLGVNVIELLPINEFNGNNSWGYNPNFYFAPDKAYGTPDDYKEFIDKCHEHGIAVVLDMVFNQSDGKHPWYQMYPISENPFYNMYASDASPAGAPHAYSVLNDWKQENPLVRQQFRDVVQYWLKEYNVDGFRFDLVKGLGDSDSYGSTYNPLTNGWTNVDEGRTNNYNHSRVVNMYDFQKAMEEVNPKAYVINENLAGAKEENEMAANGELNWANLNPAGLNYAKGTKSGSGLERMYAPYDSRMINSTVAYLESHDEERLAYVAKKSGSLVIRNDEAAIMKRLGTAAAQMILSPGAHMIWQFSEMGNSQTTKTGGQDTSAKIVDWNALENPNQHGLMETYKALIHLRLNNTDVFDTAGGAKFSMKCTSNDWADGRTMNSSNNGKEIITVINPNVNGDPITVKVNMEYSPSNYEVVLRSYGSHPQVDLAAGTVTVEPNTMVVLGTKTLSGVESVVADNAAYVPVYGTKDGVVIAGDAESVSVYDLAGHSLYSGSAANGTVIPAAKGIYVVRVEGKTAKVLVK